MIRFFACHRIPITTAAFFSLSAIVLVLAGIYRLPWQLTLTALAISFIGSIVLFEILHKKALKKLRSKLYSLCDPLSYAIDCEYCMQREKDFIQSFLFTVDLTEALIEMGDFENALAVADDNAPGGYSMPYFRCLYYTNITRIMLFLDRTTEADEYYDFLHECLADVKSAGDKGRANAYKSIMEIEYALKKGSLDKARNDIELLEKERPNPCRLVHLQLAKGELCILNDDKENAKTHLNYVIENGKGLYAVAIAKKLLREL